MPQSSPSLPEVEILSERHDVAPASVDPEPLRSRWPRTAAAIACVVVVAAGVAAIGLTDESGDIDDPETAVVEGVSLSSLVTRGTIPEALLAAESFRAVPGARTARTLFDVVGRVDGLTLGVAEGAFDLVSFHPEDPGLLLASRRSGYGSARNDGVNEMWRVRETDVDQRLFMSGIPHDVAHFNRDGSMTLWRSGTDESFAPRFAETVVGGVSVTSGPVYASRSVVVDGVVFALTGPADYYAPAREFELLVADVGGVVHVLGEADVMSWVDSPLPGIVVAYPADGSGSTRVWDVASLGELVDHPLAGLSLQRVASTPDGSVVLGVTFDERLVLLDSSPAGLAMEFGRHDPRGMTDAITLSESGDVAVTVDRNGLVSLWWVPDGRRIATIEGDAGPARLLGERRAPLSGSAVAPGGQRVALRRLGIGGDTMTWQIFTADVDSWLERACDLAGRPLTPDERTFLALDGHPPACS